MEYVKHNVLKIVLICSVDLSIPNLGTKMLSKNIVVD